MVYSVNSHTNATRIGWHLWEIDLRFAPGLPSGWWAEEATWIVIVIEDPSGATATVAKPSMLSHGTEEQMTG